MALCRSAHYDLVIVGAGMAGASLACILEQSAPARPLDILLVESAPIDLEAPPAQPSFDARSTVLSHGTVAYLETLGLWRSLKDASAPIHRIHVSDQGNFGVVRMDAAEQGVDALGHVVENRLLGTMFNRALAASTALEVCSGIQVSGLQPLQDGMRVTLKRDGEEAVIETALVVLAEGGRSGLCEKIGIHRYSEPYGQEAVIANVAFSKPHDNVAYERFTPSGPLALLPLPDLDNQFRAALVWTQPKANTQDILALPDTDFLARLQDAFGDRLGEFTRVGQRHAYPLSLVKAEEQVRPHLVLLGNVAHSLHPVAGQGFNLAFRDTMRLARVLLEAVGAGDSPGAIQWLQQYRDVTATDQDRTVDFSHYMTRLFSTSHPLAVWTRKFGLFSIDLVLPLRQAFARRAMGLAEPQVKLGKSA